MYVATQERPRTRRRRPWWSVLFALTLWPTLAAAGTGTGAKAKVSAEEAPDEDEDEDAEGGADLVTAGDRPTRAPAHADCNHRMPLYEHTVEAGEHLGIIAGRYGVRSQEVVALNPQLANPNLIRPGDVIRVCPEIFPHRVERVEHVVAAGETMGTIAARYGLSVQTLVEQQNGAIRNANLVRVGQSLTVERDGGLVPDFLPPEPGRKKTGGSGGKRARVSVPLPDSEHLHIRRPHLAYGTPKTIRLLQRAVDQYTQRHRGAPAVVVGDISRKGGGKLRPHLSHQTGRDIDMGYVLEGGQRGGPVDVARTWDLLQAFLDTHQVVYIFVDYRLQQKLYEHARARGMSDQTLEELFQYPHGRGRARGIIRHWPSHKRHFHVRFRS